MKSTRERLSESYCRPQTDKEWMLFSGRNNVPTNYKNLAKLGYDTLFFHDNGVCFFMKFEPAKRRLGLRKEVSLQQMRDILDDLIAPWRLEEDGYNTMCGVVHTLELRPVIDGETVLRKITVITDTGKVYLNDGPTNVTTYTGLLTLIKLIG